MKIIYATLLILGLLAALGAGSAVAVHVDRKYPKGGYDERQQLLRGKAYRFSYWITFAFLACVMMVDVVRRDLGLHTVPGYLLLWCVGAALGLSFNFYCLLADAYTPPADDPWGKVVGPLACAGLWLFDFFGSLKGSTLVLAEEDSGHWLRLALGISFLVQGITAWIQIFRSRKEKG